ncbi:MAG: tRNA pseudouridine(55) synthase TruB [Oscillospiraceae bacterium]|nr:tRNA pseudouridine(55) synthase TruB [Oscillospiraceae bacterium]
MGNELCGILCMNKPEGFTSFDVVAKLRGILKTRKIGHTGTLDPMASGVLPVLVGAAAKALDIMPNTDKGYEAGFKLGVSTDTQDITGKVLDEKSVSGISAEMIVKEMKAFEGEIEQIPPMYSAVSVGGKRLYELARKGIEVERQPRRINVTALSFWISMKKKLRGLQGFFAPRGLMCARL